MPKVSSSCALAAAVAGLMMGAQPVDAFLPSTALGCMASGSRSAAAGAARLRMMAGEKDMDKAVADSKAQLEAMIGSSKGDGIAMPETKVSVQASKAKPMKPKETKLEPKPIADPDRSPPPNSFAMCVEQAFVCTKAAIDDGKKLIEVEFPPLPQQALDNGALGADVILDAQISHSRQMARYFGDKKVAIVFADIVERNRFLEDTSFGGKSAKMKADKRGCPLTLLLSPAHESLTRLKTQGMPQFNRRGTVLRLKPRLHPRRIPLMVSLVLFMCLLSPSL